MDRLHQALDRLERALATEIEQSSERHGDVLERLTEHVENIICAVQDKSFV